MAEEPAPKVADERFWLGRAAEIIQESAKKLDEGAQRIAAAMGWFWTVYSTAAAATLALSGPTLPVGTAILAASPTLALFLAYALATWASLPVPIAFNVLEPSDIKAAHEKAITTKRTRVAVSLAFAAAGAVLAALAVFAFALASQRQDRGLGIAVSATSTGADVVAGGIASADATVLVRVTPAGGATESRLALTKKDEPFAIPVPVGKAATYDVEVSWEAGGRTTLLRETLKSP